MPSVAVKLYSVFFKFLLKHRLQTINQIQTTDAGFGPTTRPEESVVAANPVFTDGVATKDIHIDPSTSLSIRIFLPESALLPDRAPKSANPIRRSTLDPARPAPESRRNSYAEGVDNGRVYRGYLPKNNNPNDKNSYNNNNINNGNGNSKMRKMPVMLQFHGGGFVSGSKDTVANDVFCRRIAKLCDVIVVAVGYRLAPENKYPAAFEDGWKVLSWLAKQANLADCSRSLFSNGGGSNGGHEGKRLDGGVVRRSVADTFGASMVEPWLAAHADPTRCVLLGVSCGANISDYVARKAVESGKLLDPVKVVAQLLLYPFFIGSVPTHSEIKLANSYFYDKPMCVLAWKLFLPEEEFNLDHPAANPLIPNRGPPLKLMPPTLTVVAEHDWMRDRAIAYSEELRRVNVDAPVLEYKDAVHEFATLDMLLNTPQALACAEDIAIWVKKYISIRGHEFSY
ncbi:hypothetical protein RND81_04G176000 [Saponaria officinalis]|uniref:Alpha/beta hydrolase fold-3 domain-containing protein n=1 Tax=Saponaria officinalis TaxID=3572 RepID=A0AAW1LM45_SAPOF